MTEHHFLQHRAVAQYLESVLAFNAAGEAGMVELLLRQLIEELEVDMSVDQMLAIAEHRGEHVVTQ